MAAKKPRYWIANHHAVRITRRKLSTFEERNPRLFTSSRTPHDTFDEARNRLIAVRMDMLARAARDLAHAQKALQRALDLKPPAQEGDGT